MNSAETILKTVLVHEDSITGLRAVNLIKRLTAKLEHLLGTEINPWDVCDRIWRFEWLRNPQLWEEAVSRSATADVIIISAEDHTELPACVRSWIESVLPRIQGGQAILVALLEGHQIAGMGSLPPARYLRQLAEHHGVDFLCNLDEPEQPTRVELGIEKALSRITGAARILPVNSIGENNRASMTSPWPTTNDIEFN
jgi:hypothetical protein